MIIRSQDKKKTTTDLNLHISECDFAKDNITYRICTSTHDWLGEYSTEEKAIKVLDMICEAYCRMEDVKCGAVQAQKQDSFCFNMPSDGEVEVQIWICGY